MVVCRFWETPDVEVPQYFDHRGDPEANKGHNKDEQAVSVCYFVATLFRPNKAWNSVQIKSLVLRLDMAEARVATLASTSRPILKFLFSFCSSLLPFFFLLDTATKLETIFQMVLAKLEKIQ